MEVLSEEGIQIRMKPGQTQELGRFDGLKSLDNTISRRHILFFIPKEPNNQEIHVQFEVLGRNPVYVSKDNEVKIFRRFERGEMGDGDMFCVSAKNPVWYTVRKVQNGTEGVRQNDSRSELKESLESASGQEGVKYLDDLGLDISHIDPVKEFGFLVEGHEFDSYPKKMIKSFKDWEWFLEEEKEKDSEDDDDVGKKGKSRKRKRRKGENDDDDDDEWSGESEDEKVVLMDKSVREEMVPKYKTRSKHQGKDASKRKRKSPTGSINKEDEEEEEEDEDEEDATLGGFIVGDENLEDQEEEEEEEEEEELDDEDDEEE